jgi:apolipoprotein N-acyltransferase
MTMRRRFALAALSGLLVFAAFPGVGAWPIAFVAWVPLLLALEDAPWRRAALLGLVAGLCATLPAFRFLYPTLRAESGLGPVACALVVLAVAAYHALRGAVIGAVSRSGGDGPGPPALLFVAGLALSEIAIPSLFPWYFGASVHAVPLFLQPAEIGGPVAVSVVLSLSSVGIAETISSWRPDRQTKPRVIVPALAVPIVLALWGSLRISQIDARVREAPRITVGVVQPNLGRAAETEVVRRHREATEELASKGAELVVWAEGALPWTLPVPLVEDAFGTFRAPPVGILTGGLVQGQDAPPGDAGAARRVTNSALLFDGGKWVGRYDKHRLLPFSESLPFESALPWLRSLSPRSGSFAAGTSEKPLVFRGHGIATFICYEDLFPGHVRALASGGDVEMLANLTNDSWFLGSDEPRMHLALARLRAVEQRKFFVRATLTGVSAIVDPVGRELGIIPEGQSGTLLAEARWMRGRTIYGLLGDAPWWLFSLGSIALVLLRRSPRRAA